MGLGCGYCHGHGVGNFPFLMFHKINNDCVNTVLDVLMQFQSCGLDPSEKLKDRVLLEDGRAPGTS